jgi:hypothetical protein
MSLSYDPDERPRPSDEMIDCAVRNGMHVINVMCDERGSTVGDHTCASFAAIVTFLPRAGDRIGLEDGRTCEVTRVYFKIARVQGHVSLFPNVYAVLIEPPEKPQQ